MRNKIYLLILLLLASYIKNFAQTDSTKSFSFTLSEAQNYAVENSFDIKNKQIDIEIAQKQIWQTTAIGLPQLKIKGSWQYIFEVPEMTMYSLSLSEETPFIPVFNVPNDPTSGVNYMLPNFEKRESKLKLGLQSNITFDITLSQILFSGEYIVGLQASRVWKQVSTQSLEKSQRDIKETIAQSYYLVLTMQKNIEFIDSSYQNIQKMVTEMEQMYKVGYIEETEVSQIKLTASNLENTLSSMKRLEQISERLIKFQLGIEFENEIVLTENLDEVISNLDMASLMLEEFEASNSIDYQILTTQEQLSVLSLRREQSKYLPTVVAFYNHNEQLDAPAFNFSTPDMIGVSLEWNLFTSGLRHTTVQQKKLELAKIENSKQQVEMALTLEYHEAQSKFVTAHESYLINKQTLEYATKIYNNTIQKYKTGTASSLDITLTQNQLLETQNKYFNAVIEFLNAKATLDKILGN